MRCIALTAMLVLSMPSIELAHADPAVDSPPPSDAAAKHAKRTACLKEAKAKKMLGPDKKSFLKSCMAAG
jgi:hypothetical protein